MTFNDLMYQIQDMSPEERNCKVVVQFSEDGYRVYKPVTLGKYDGETYGGLIQEKHPILKAGE